METPTKKQLPNIAALRGFLALTVVLLHVPLMTKNIGLPSFNDWPILQKGYNAVWVFFSLSGFLIINLLYKEKSKKGQVNVLQFYKRRILRIYPVYYFVLIFGLIYYHYLLPFLGVKFETNYSILEALLWCVGFLPNVFFSLFDPGGILSVLWSIGIEEQFYLIIAPISRFIKSERFTLVLAIFTLVYFTCYFIPEFEFLRRYRFMFFYFSMGGLIAILNQQGKINVLIFSGILKWTLYLFFGVYFFTNLLDFSNEVLKHLVGLILFPLFILNISEEKQFIISSRIWNYLGEISYGIYMYHMIALNSVIFLFLKLELSSILPESFTILLLNLATILMTIVFAHISYFYVERRFINLKQHA
ncbi:MAG: acyltransferase family protein [Flavobacteriia bacterium]|jgi:peptidoglycan/LPS O-acetylase OafA/YrhL